MHNVREGVGYAGGSTVSILETRIAQFTVEK